MQVLCLDSCEVSYVNILGKQDIVGKTLFG